MITEDWLIDAQLQFNFFCQNNTWHLNINSIFNNYGKVYFLSIIKKEKGIGDHVSLHIISFFKLK